MVKIVETDDVHFHRFNQKYPCVLFVFDLGKDKNFMDKGKGKFDYMPTTAEIVEFIKVAHKRIPELKKKLLGVLDGK